MSSIVDPQSGNDAEEKEEEPKLFVPQGLGHSRPFEDPVRREKPKKPKPKKVDDGSKMKFVPSMGTRITLAYPELNIPEPGAPRIKYAPPKTKKQIREAKERREKFHEFLNRPQYETIQMAKPKGQEKVPVEMELASPEVSKAKVTPKRPSITSSMSYPGLPAQEDLEAKKPKSGIFINETEGKDEEDVDSFDLVYQRKPRPGYDDELKKGKKRKRYLVKEEGKEDRHLTEEEYEEYKKNIKKERHEQKKIKEEPKTPKTEEEMPVKVKEEPVSPKPATVKKEPVDVKQESPEISIDAMKVEAVASLPGVGEIGDIEVGGFPTIMEETEEDMESYEEEGETEETYLTRLFRRKVSQASKATSLREQDLISLPVYEDQDMEQEPVISRIVQKFRRDSEEQRYKPPKKKVIRGTLESHSFTKIKQETLKTFIFGCKAGSMNQDDEHFSPISRNNQGICMPVAAYCYAMVKHPRRWTEKIVDEILEIGDELYRESLEDMHEHERGKVLKGKDLARYCNVGDFKMRFEVDEPYITGVTDTRNKRVYNITKALKIFFKTNRAGIFQSGGYDILIWKDKFFYFFDAAPRNYELYPDVENGRAHVANFYDVPAVVTILLERTNLTDLPFTISRIRVLKVKRKGENIEDDSSSVIQEGSVYNIVDGNRAVVRGTFDLADLCFEFSRNKQALAMAVVCLTYSRISPPTSWRRRTIDKIMVIGNELYIECAEYDSVDGELKLDDLPAIYTIGPYLVNVFVYSNLFADVMFKKGKCQFLSCLQDFFEKNNNAIVQIGKCTLAIWLQRNMYYCFDPYSRNNEGLKCRDGSACVSMNANLETLVETVITNFPDKEAVFYIHSLKVLKIHRDPTLSIAFPIAITIDSYPLEKFKEYKMKKSKKKATEKPVTVDFNEMAMKKLLAGEFPEPSILEVDSNVGSLLSRELPPMKHKLPLKTIQQLKAIEDDVVADLDSPSLSDTQIEPERIKPEPDEEVEGDADTFDLTIEEQELMGGAEDEGLAWTEAEGGELAGGDYEGGEGEEEINEIDEMYIAFNVMSQVGSHSLESYHSKVSMEVNTSVTCGYLPLKRKLLRPTSVGGKRKTRRDRYRDATAMSIYEKEVLGPEVTQSEELAKESNFVDLPDGTQLIRGTQNMIAYSEDLEFMAPFVCMMAAAVAKKFKLLTWSSEIVDYVLKCGAELYKAVKVRYDQVPVIEIPRVSLGKTDYSIYVEYMYDSEMKQDTLELALQKILFSKTDNGLIVTPSYACAVFLRNHLYYLYDGFGNSEVGMSEGPDDSGVACLARFKDIHPLATRIMYNKSKREGDEPFTYTRFVLSSCHVSRIPPAEETEIKRRRSRREKMEEEMEREQQIQGEDEVPEKKSKEIQERKGTPKEEEEKKEPDIKRGYQEKEKGLFVLEGSKGLQGQNEASEQLKSDHFVCLCAAIMLLNCPVDKWDTRKVDEALEQGNHVYSHAEDLDVSEKRTIKNILIDKYFFDIVVKRISIMNPKLNRNISKGIDTLLEKKKNYFLVQFPNTCYVIHKHDGCFHLFDPYSCEPIDKNGERKEGKAGWTKFEDARKLKRKIRKSIVKGAESYAFYNFEVMSIKKAPKKFVISETLHTYEEDKAKPKDEKTAGKPFYEDESWLDADIPWSRMYKKSDRGKSDNMWHEWNVEIKRNLHSLFGTLHQNSTKFSPETRGKQTLANLTVAIAMTEIYELSEWNTAIMDSILVNGDNYFMECIKDNKEENYEITIDDLKPECTIFPYSISVTFQPVVEGTVFIVRLKQFNLYKALRAFFDTYENRTGIICVTKGERKKYVAFGKIQEREYFMYDCASFGPPMFIEREGCAYMLRCSCLKRLLHVMTVTLRGGDFYIYQVEVTQIKPIQ